MPLLLLSVQSASVYKHILLGIVVPPSTPTQLERLPKKSDEEKLRDSSMRITWLHGPDTQLRKVERHWPKYSRAVCACCVLCQNLTVTEDFYSTFIGNLNTDLQWGSRRSRPQKGLLSKLVYSSSMSEPSQASPLDFHESQSSTLPCEVGGALSHRIHL